MTARQDFNGEENDSSINLEAYKKPSPASSGTPKDRPKVPSFTKKATPGKDITKRRSYSSKPIKTAIYI